MAAMAQADPAADLDWLFGRSESEMGIRSNFVAGLLAMQIGHQDSYCGPDGVLSSAAAEAIEHAWQTSRRDLHDATPRLSRAAAARRMRRVSEAYASLNARQKMILELWFAPRQRPDETRRIFGAGAGILHLTATGSGMVLDERTVARIARKGGALAGRLLAEANALYQDALDAYQRARSNGARITPRRAYDDSPVQCEVMP